MQLKPENRRLALDLQKGAGTLVMDGKTVASFDVDRHDTLTEATVRDLDTPEAGHRLIVFKRSSPQARALLRERGISYAASNGELWIHAPPVHVERSASRGDPKLTSTLTSPFAVRASRVPRWLLLHPQARPFVGELSEAVELSESVVSRAVRALADDALVTVQTDLSDARRRSVQLRDTSLMLDAFERATAPRRFRRQTWEVGARDAAAAMERVRSAAKHLRLPYAIGGLAGASFIRRVVEPSVVDVWIGRNSLDVWMDGLGGTPSRPGQGRLTVQVAADPFLFSLAAGVEGIKVADPVQLYLDCRRQGERALEAASAIRTEMSW